MEDWCAWVQGGLDHRVSGAIITASECAALLAAFVIVLSMLGVNVNALLLPAGVALAFAAKDLSHNFLAGAAQMSTEMRCETVKGHRESERCLLDSACVG